MEEKKYAPVREIIKEEQFDCQVLHASLNGNKIDVLLLFPNGKTILSSVEYNGFSDTLTWTTDEKENATAKVTVQFIRVNGYYELDIDNPIRYYIKGLENIKYPERWIETTHEFQIIIDKLNLNRNSFIK